MTKAKKTHKIAILPKEKQPFSIPENWLWTDIDSINHYQGSQIEPMKQPDVLFELYSVPSSTEDYPEIITGSEIGSSKQSVAKNDVLLCKINPRINRVWKVSQHTDYELVASSEWIVVRNTVINPDYLMYCLKAQYFREFMLSNVSGVGGSLMRAQPKFVKNYPIPIAPIAEQQRIVERIEGLFAKLDEAKEKAQAVVDGFETRKAAILHKAFIGELTAQWRQENHIGLDTWEQPYFDDCINKMQNGIAKRSGSNGIPYVVLRLANLSNDGFNTEDLREIVLNEKEQLNYELKPNDVLMIRVNGSKENVGKQFLITNQGHWAFCDHIIRIVYSKKVLPQYMVLFSKSEEYRLYVKDNMVSSAGQNTISRKGMARLKVPLPQVIEQVEIVRILDNLFAKEQQAKEAAESVLDQIDIMKKSILARAFRGKLGTNNLGEESSIELLKQIFE